MTKFYQIHKTKSSFTVNFLSLQLILFLLLIFSSIVSYSQFPGADNTPGVGKTFTVPAGVTSVTATAWGGGGGGGGSDSNGNRGNGGGGGGAISLTVAVTNGNIFTYTVGSGGAAGAAANGTGGNGTSSSIFSLSPSTNMTANPGTGGRGNNQTLNTPTNSTGGTASGGTTNNSGLNGIQGGNGGNSGTITGIFGVGGAGGGSGSPGVIGGSPGAGGGGGLRQGGGDQLGGAGANGRVFFQYIRVTSITPNPVCVGSTITITGSNFDISATTVTINGTPCTSVTVVNATTITAVVGAGTTSGVVLITNANGTNNGQSITVNPAPATIGGGAATVCTGSTSPAFTNATPGGTWSTSNGNATINASGVVTGVTVGTVNVIYTLPTTCSITRTITIITVPPAAATPTPANAATNICYAGIGAVSSISWGAVSGATSYDVYFGAGSVPGTITANVLTNSYSTGALAASTTYFWRVVAKNACGNAVTSATFSFTTTSTPCIGTYCAPTYTNGPGTVDGITNVTLGTLNNNSTGNNVSPYYTFYNAVTIPTILRPLSTTISIRYGSDPNQWGAVWIDFNQNAVFEASEGFISTANAGANGTSVITITVPAGALLGNTRMRVRGGNDSILTTAQACGASSSIYGETEDYIVNIADAPPCTTPTAQPTAINLTAQGTIISGSFTAASPVPNNYLVVYSTSATPPIPANGTNYSIGATVGAGYIVADNDANTIFTITGLTTLTNYYIYIFSYNNLCNGGTQYLTTSPLTGNITTTNATYCIPSSAPSSRFIQNVSTAGNITNLSNTASGIATNGYADYTALPPVTQIAGGGVTIDYLLTGASQFVKIWVDWDNLGTFTDAAPELVYSTSGVQTIAGSAGFVVPIGTPAGNYRIRIRSFQASQTFGPCDPGLSTGETEDYRLVVVGDCPAKLVTLTDGSRCDTGTVNLNVTGTSGVTQFRFYDAIKGGNLVGTSATGSFTTPSITTTTNYFVTAVSGTCESNYREKIVAKVNPTTVINVTPSTPAVCGENNVVSVLATGDVETAFLINENFETGTFNTFSRVNIAADANTEWIVRTSPYVPTGSVWKPAITSRNIGNRYALAISDFAAPAPKDTQLRSANLNASTFSTLTLNFRHYFSFYVGEVQQFADVEVSTDGGTVWALVRRFSSTEGFAGEYKSESINMNAYAGQPQVMVRFKYRLEGSAFCDGWAIDDVELFGTKPLNTTFTWSGGAIATFIDAACTIPYTSQSVTTIYVRPAGAQISSPSWSFTATATLGNGCPVSKDIVITNNTKSWIGTNTNWNDAANWEPAGIPAITNCVVIPSSSRPPVLGAGAGGAGKNLEVKSGGVLEVNTSNSLTIQENININSGGTFRVRNNSSLVQIDNVPNTVAGTFTYDRTAPLIKGSDYVYWSSPVANQDMSTIYTTPVSGPKYQWNTTAANANGGLGTWGNASGIMLPAKGYIMRGSSNYGMVATNLNSVFTGTPNNGNLLIKATRGNMVPANVGPALLYSNSGLNAFDDNWTLVGNPYPSSINALQFLATNNTELLGNVRLWRHLSYAAAITSPFYQSFTYNYNSGDYLTVNYTGATTPGASDIIKAGQAFLVQRVEGPQDLAGIDVTFNNAMRLTPTGTVMNNSGFFRTSGTNQEPPTVIERNRIWLDIVDATTNASETTLVGYVDGATANFDSKYDATIGITNAIGIYTFAENQKCIIQGKPVPFVQQDIVPIGINVQTNGQYHIAIKSLDGLFLQETQTIYLEDRLMNVVHNLKTSPYSFTSNSGNHDNRFVLRYTPNAPLSTNDFIKSNDVKIFRNDKINIVSGNENISNVKVYDILGKLIYSKQNINSKNIMLNELSETKSLLIVKVILDNKEEIVKKIIF